MSGDVDYQELLEGIRRGSEIQAEALWRTSENIGKTADLVVARICALQANNPANLAALVEAVAENPT